MILIFLLMVKIIRNNRIDKLTNSNLSGDYEKYTINYGGVERYYLLHIPESYNNKETPVVLAFHGGMGTAENMADKYGLIEKADEEGFIVAFPNGASKLSSGKIGTWNAGSCCAYAVESNSDDVGFTKAVIGDIKSKVKVSKFFATGMSNGGMFSHRLACDMADTFSAVAAVAGTNNYASCNPSRSIPVMNIHSLNDQHVLFEGGCGPECRVDSETDFSSVNETVSEWIERNNCDKTPERVLDVTGAYCDVYKCPNNVQVKLCVTEDGGHSWPGSMKEGASNKIIANDEIWSFFSEYI